jgi:hypothetical protein
MLSRFIVCKLITNGKAVGIRLISLFNDIYKYLSFSLISQVFTSFSKGIEIVFPYSSSRVFLTLSLYELFGFNLVFKTYRFCHSFAGGQYHLFI